MISYTQFRPAWKPVRMTLYFIMVLHLANAQKDSIPAADYILLFGNTHAHTILTKSHGAQWEREPGYDQYMMVDSAGVSHAVHTRLRSDWQKIQGDPRKHFEMAKEAGYDFYISTDHSQEEAFHPTSDRNKDWIATAKAAKDLSDKNFIAIRGYEHSENNGPGGQGHINIINSLRYVNALEEGVDLAYLYGWLDTEASNGEGPIVGTFNHPGPNQYDDFNGRTAGANKVICMLEMINSNNHIHYEGFLEALAKGWKVSPVCGNDNHGTEGIGKLTSRTVVLSEGRSKKQLLEAMQQRRTYATLEQNLECRYTVNGALMGSEIPMASSYQFDIFIEDPDSQDPMDLITAVDIVTDDGKVVASYSGPAGYRLQWKPVLRADNKHFYFVRVWNAGGGDAPKADSSKPVAWLAPVWPSK